jgi:hypothetical protein
VRYFQVLHIASAAVAPRDFVIESHGVAVHGGMADVALSRAAYGVPEVCCTL